MEVRLHLLPQVLERTTHDNEILPRAVLIPNMFWNQELLAETEALHDAVRTGLRSHQPRHDAIDPALGREVEEFSCEQRAESGSLPIVGNDQADLRDVITPPVALEMQRPIGHDLVIVHHHQALDPTSVELGGTSFNHPAAGHVNP